MVTYMEIPSQQISGGMVSLISNRGFHSMGDMQDRLEKLHPALSLLLVPEGRLVSSFIPVLDLQGESLRDQPVHSNLSKYFMERQASDCWVSKSAVQCIHVCN
jgi:hypothetical protein